MPFFKTYNLFTSHLKKSVQCFFSCSNTLEVLDKFLAVRAKLLMHHPDKRGSIKTETSSEDYFTCITRAYEQLGLSVQKRRAYDSVDPLFDDSLPDEKRINSDNFFDVFEPVFLRNARFVK